MDALQVLLATDREGIRTLVDAVADQAQPPWRITRLPTEPAALRDAPPWTTATFALIDVIPCPEPAAALAHEIRRVQPGLPVVALVCCPQCLQGNLFLALRAAGVTSFVDLRGGRDAFQRVARAVLQGQTVLQLHAPMANGDRLLDPELDPLRWPTLRMGEVTPREQLVLQALATGDTQEQIAAAHHLSRSTLKRTLRQLQARLNAPTLFALGMEAVRRGLVVGAVDRGRLPR